VHPALSALQSGLHPDPAESQAAQSAEQCHGHDRGHADALQGRSYADLQRTVHTITVAGLLPGDQG